jgi:hypothetical protein
MKRTRIYFLMFGVGLLVLFGLIFQEFLYANIILPSATVVWILLRVFILSIDQQYYWGLLILVVAGFTIFRIAQNLKNNQPIVVQVTNPTVDGVTQWRQALLFSGQAHGEINSVKRELIWLLTMVYASQQQGVVNYRVREALEQGEIPLPEEIYRFLFSGAAVSPRKSLFKHPLGAVQDWLDTIRSYPHKWMRRWSGRETADYYLAIDKALSVMETSLEIKHDHDPFNPNQH